MLSLGHAHGPTVAASDGECTSGDGSHSEEGKIEIMTTMRSHARHAHTSLTDLGTVRGKGAETLSPYKLLPLARQQMVDSGLMEFADDGKTLIVTAKGRAYLRRLESK